MTCTPVHAKMKVMEKHGTHLPRTYHTPDMFTTKPHPHDHEHAPADGARPPPPLP